MRYGRGMSLNTIAKRAGIFAGADAGPDLPDYVANPQVGDTVEWIHQVNRQNQWMSGKVIHLLAAREDDQQYRGKIGIKRWRKSKNYNGCKRVIVEVQTEHLPFYYTVTYHRMARNHFRVVKTAGEANAS